MKIRDDLTFVSGTPETYRWAQLENVAMANIGAEIALHINHWALSGKEGKVYRIMGLRTALRIIADQWEV